MYTQYISTRHLFFARVSSLSMTSLALTTVVPLDIIGLFLTIAGFSIGLGAVTVIDWLGFLGRKSPYWTEATIRAHKITKPLIWLGIICVSAGMLIFFRNESFSNIPLIFIATISALVANGLFLSFWISPRLIERERDGHADELLPRPWQAAIALSFIISFTGWWSMVFLFCLYLLGVR